MLLIFIQTKMLTHVMQFLPINFNFQFLIPCCHLDQQSSCVAYCNAAVQNCFEGTDGSFRHNFASQSIKLANLQKHNTVYSMPECTGYAGILEEKWRLWNYCCKVQTREDNTALQLWNCNIVQQTLKAV